MRSSLRRPSCASTSFMSRSRGFVERLADRVRRDLVEHHALAPAPCGFERLEHVPADGLALAILVGREDELVGALQRLLQLGDDLLLVGGNDVAGVEVVVGVDAGEPAVGGLLVVRDLFLAARQVTDVPDARLHRVIAAEIARDGLRLRRGLHDHERFRHCFSTCLSRHRHGLRRHQNASLSALGSRTVARHPSRPGPTGADQLRSVATLPLCAQRLTCAAVITAVNWLSPQRSHRDLRDDRPHPRRVRRVRDHPGPPPGRLDPVPRRRVLRHERQARATRTSTSRSSSSDRSSPPSPARNSGTGSAQRYGTRLFKPDARLFKTEYLERAQEFFDKRGPRAVVLARFIPFVRTIVPMLAGAGRMPQRKFVTANVIGAAIWAVGVSLLGFWLGQVDRHRQVHLPDRRGDHRAVVDPAVPRVPHDTSAPQASSHVAPRATKGRPEGRPFATVRR